MKGPLALFVTAAAVLLPHDSMAAFPDARDKVRDYLKSLKADGPDSTRIKAASAALDSLNKYFDQRTAFKGTITLGLDGDEAEGKSRYDLNTAIAAAKGQYPRQLVFAAKTRFQFTDEELTEDISAFLVSYDYYPHPQWEIYVNRPGFSGGSVT